MPRFAANVSTMFTELEVPKRFQAARDAGFEAVEYLHPYDYSIAELEQWLADAGLDMILLNTSRGDAARGERGFAALPGREADFHEHFNVALEYASGLGVGMMHLMAGVVPAGADRRNCEEVFVANLQSVADLARAQGVTILLEPLNTQDVPGYLHTRTEDTRRIIEAVGSDNVLMQFDFYHRQIMEGNLAARLRDNLEIVGHIQFSSVPGRHEPQHGEVNMPFLFDVVDALGYAGWIGCEYGPKTTTMEGLSWGAAYNLG